MAKQVKNTDLIEKGIFTPSIKSADELTASLDKLDAGFMKVIKTAKKGLKGTKLVDLADVEKASKAIKDVDSAAKGLTATQKERVKLKEKLKQQNSTEIQQNIQLKRQIQEQAKANKDLEIVQSKNAGTLQKLAAQSRILRRERDRLNLDTEKGRKRLQEINKELDKNNKKVLENSDKLKKQRLNVGNYSDSIKEAASASGLFGGVLGKLNQIQGVLNALTKTNTVEEEVNTAAKEVNTAATVQMTAAQRSLNFVTGAGTKALKVFKVALASTGIGALVLAVGGLIAFFTRAQDGVDALSKGFAGLTAGIDVIIDRFEAVGAGLVDVFKGLTSLDFDKVSEGVNKIGEAFEGVGDELTREVKLATELEELTIKLTREQKLFEAEQAKTLTTIKELTITAKNKLAVDQDRLDAVQQINELEIETAEKQLKLQEQALASSLDSISADKTRLELGAEQLDFIERIKNGQIGAAEAVQLAADFTLSSAAGYEALEEIIDKIVAQEQARQSLLDKQATTARRTASITQEIANKRSKSLLQEAKLQQLIAKDEDESIQSRIEAIEKVRDFSVSASKVRLEANLINTQEFIAFKLTEEKRAQEAIQKLLLKTNEVIDKDLEKRIKKQVTTINQIEQEQFKFEIDRLSERIEAEETTQEERLKLIDKANQLRKAQLEAQADFELTQAGLTADEIQELRETGSIERIQSEETTAEEVELINQKLNNDLANLETERTDQAKAESEKRKEEELSARKESLKNANETASQTVDIFDESFKEITDKRLEALQKEQKQSEDNLTRQEELARQGVEGAAEIAAFERQKQAEIAAQQKEIEQKRQLEEQVAQLVSTYFNFLDARTSAAETDEEVNAAPQKALQDTAKAAVISQGAKGLAGLIAGSAFEGTEDTGGAGTIDSKGGKLWILHPHEGVVKREANENYAGLVGAMNNGDVDSWMMKNIMIQPNMNFDSRTKEDIIEKSYQQLTVEMQNVKKAIENKPVPNLAFDELANVIESWQTGRGVETIKHQRQRKKI